MNGRQAASAFVLVVVAAVPSIDPVGRFYICEGKQRDCAERDRHAPTHQSGHSDDGGVFQAAQVPGLRRKKARAVAENWFYGSATRGGVSTGLSTIET